uniref:Axonemal dynein light intermediate polypeptide 1 n=1 Tax=Nothobranchius furzeri TaxID=105023 RepID=A0A8C6VVW8_NOTFU
MIELDDSLLKYDDPVLVKRTASSSTKGRHLRLSPQQSIDSAPTPPPPRSTSTSFQAKQENGILITFPPRKWDNGNQLWVQQVSRAPSGRADVQQLVKLLDTKLQQRQAKPTGICPLRRELYSQCFDEVIRQVDNNCAVRALLLAEVRYEMNRIIAIYKVQYEDGLAFGIRKALQAEDEENDMEQRVRTYRYYARGQATFLKWLFIDSLKFRKQLSCTLVFHPAKSAIYLVYERDLCLTTAFVKITTTDFRAGGGDRDPEKAT